MQKPYRAACASFWQTYRTTVPSPAAPRASLPRRRAPKRATRARRSHHEPDDGIPGLPHQIDVDLVGSKQPDPFGPDIFWRGDPAGNGSGNSRNGSCGKAVTTVAGPVPTSCPAVPADQAEPHGPDPFPDGLLVVAVVLQDGPGAEGACWAWRGFPGLPGVHAHLRGQHHERRLGRIADDRTVVGNGGVGAQHQPQ
jgi:hypothetical protein